MLTPISVGSQEYEMSQEWQEEGVPRSFQNMGVWEGTCGQGRVWESCGVHSSVATGSHSHPVPLLRSACLPSAAAAWSVPLPRWHGIKPQTTLSLLSASPHQIPKAGTPSHSSFCFLQTHGAGTFCSLPGAAADIGQAGALAFRAASLTFSPLVLALLRLLQLRLLGSLFTQLSP